jgi:hypothetical protein
MALSLDDVLAIPANVDEERLRRMGLLPQPQPAPSLIAPATAPIPKLSPVTAPAAETPAAVEKAPALSPLTPQVDQNAVKPMVPPTLNFHERQALPTSSPGAPIGSAANYEAELAREKDKEANPWGTPENHPGTLGKIGHVLSRIGNIAGDVVAPATMAIIPGTDLNRKEREAGLENRIEAAKKEETAEEAVRQRPELAELKGEEAGRLQAEKDIAAEQREKERLESAEKIAGGRETSAEKIAGGREASAEKIAAGRTKSAEEIAKERTESAERIAIGHNLAITEAARIRAAAANDPDKLTNTMKTMKQQAQSTLPGIDRALDETEKIAAKLGPVEGRWNDFWQGKIGASDPDFAHYKDEIALVSSAVTLAHARGRMSNELFNHFQKMFDAGHQAPENMIQALNVAKEWLTEYAKMGEKPAAGGAATQIHNGFEYTKGEDGLWHKGKAVPQP